MGKPTDPAAAQQTTDSLDALIDEAMGACRMLPRRERCEELNEQLRAAIARLMPAVQQQADRLTRYSRDWYRYTGILEDTREELRGSLGSGLLSAAIHLAAIGRQARALADAVESR